MSDKKPFISLVVPVHNESSNLEWHHKHITQALAVLPITYEIIYIDDGSTDDSLGIIKQLRKQDGTVRYSTFSRNFGKEAATSAGLRKALGDAAVMIDADGQHPVEIIGEFINKWQEGNKVVIGIRSSNTKEGLIKKYGSKLFYKMLNSLSGGGTIPRSTDFRLLDRRVIDEFNQLTEHNRITRGLIDWLGFKRDVVEFDAPARHSGKASYGLNKLIRLALHAFVSQTTRPLQIGGILGGITVCLSAVAGLFLLIEDYILGDPLNLAITGSAVLAIFVSFLVGLVLICQWLLAIYIESIHQETQNRPLYIVDEDK
jgi:glycosyltransferase involved in cell wall biosynthesis